VLLGSEAVERFYFLQRVRWQRPRAGCIVVKIDEISFEGLQLLGEYVRLGCDRLEPVSMVTIERDCEFLLRATLDAETLTEDLLDEAKVSFGVDADGVVLGRFDVNLDTVLKEAELFEALGAFELAYGQGRESVERGLAIGVEADVLPVGRGGAVAVVWDGCAGEI